MRSRNKQGKRPRRALWVPLVAAGMAATGAAWAQDEAVDLPAQTVVGEAVKEKQVSGASKTPVKLREIPQTVNVVGQ